MVTVKPTHLQHHSYIHATELAIQYMKEHLNEEVTSEQLAHLVGYSAYHFTRIFKQVTGMNFTTPILVRLANGIRKTSPTETTFVANEDYPFDRLPKYRLLPSSVQAIRWPIT